MASFVKRPSSFTTGHLAGYDPATRKMVDLGAPEEVAPSSFGEQLIHTFLGGPLATSAATPTFRVIGSDDIPDLSTAKLTTGVMVVARGGTGTGTAFTSGRVVVAGASGVYAQDANLSWAGTTLTVAGTVAATTLTGAGSGITALSAANISAGTLAVARGGTGQTAFTNGQVVFVSAGVLTGSTQLTWDGTSFTIGAAAYPYLNVYDSVALKLFRLTVDATYAYIQTTDSIPLFVQAPILVKCGGSVTAKANVGGTLFDHFADVSSAGTDDETETLYADTILANTLSANGAKLIAEYSAVTVAHATATRGFAVRFAGEMFLQTDSFATVAADHVSFRVVMIRKDATHLRYVAVCEVSNATGVVIKHYVKTGETGALVFSDANAVEFLALVGGVGSAAGDIVAKMGTILYFPPAV